MLIRRHIFRRKAEKVPFRDNEPTHLASELLMIAGNDSDFCRAGVGCLWCNGAIMFPVPK